MLQILEYDSYEFEILELGIIPYVDYKSIVVFKQICIYPCDTIEILALKLHTHRNKTFNLCTNFQFKWTLRFKQWLWLHHNYKSYYHNIIGQFISCMGIWRFPKIVVSNVWLCVYWIFVPVWLQNIFRLILHSNLPRLACLFKNRGKNAYG